MTAPRDDRRWALLATLVYTAVIAVIAYRHELWRDEVRALNIAAGSSSLAELFKNLENEGHPALWYLVLYAGYRVTGSMLVLKPIAAALASGAMYLFFRFAPSAWRRWQKAVFAAGVFPLYEYSVMCRNYGISMLLSFATAALWPRRFTHPVPLAIVLALLANTNAYALIVVLALGFALVLERRLAAPERSSSLAVTLAALAVLFGGVAASAATMAPHQTTTVTGDRVMTVGSIASSAVSAVVCPGHFFFHDLLSPSSSFLLHVVGWISGTAVSVGLWLFAATLLPRVWLSLAFLATAAGFSLFTDVVYPSSLRHWGLLLLLGIVLVWVQSASPVEPRGRYPRVQRALLALVLIGHVALAAYPVGQDVVGSFSSSEAFGAFLRARPDLADATVVVEPDYLFEALPYYVRNPVYQPREHRYLLKVNFTAANQLDLSLDELMATADALARHTKRPVVIALGFEPAADGPFVRKVGYKGTFAYSAEAREAFVARTTLLARFDGARTDENYVVYLWKP